MKEKMVQRDRSRIKVSVLHVEISEESHELLRALAAAKRMPVGGYVDVWLRKKREKLTALGVIQSDDSALSDKQTMP